MDTVSAFVAIVGRPNVGKSSLLNALVGKKVAIVSDKPQTTRTRIMGVVTRDKTQLVFLDTPGNHKPRTRLGDFMVRSIGEAVSGVDVALMVTEPRTAIREEEQTLLNQLKQKKLPVILVINKIDTVTDKAQLLTYIDAWTQQMDFAAIVDHLQMRHFFLPCRDDKYLICGTEPGTIFTDVDKPTYAKKLDYTMIFPDKTGLKNVLDHFPFYGFTGTPEEGSFPFRTMERGVFQEIAEYVYSIGGLMSHAHPRQMMYSQDPLDYYFGDHVPLETVHVAADNYATRQNRQLWITLLKLGKRVRTHGSSDSHGPVSNRGLTAVYAPAHSARDIFNVIRSGDCTAGGVAIQMSIDGAGMGSVTDYVPGKTLFVRVAEFHPAHQKENTAFCLRVYTDRGLAYAREFDCRQPQALALEVQDRLYYRVEITNESDGCLVALSNPIWLEAHHES